MYRMVSVVSEVSHFHGVGNEKTVFIVGFCLLEWTTSLSMSLKHVLKLLPMEPKCRNETSSPEFTCNDHEWCHGSETCAVGLRCLPQPPKVQVHRFSFFRPSPPDHYSPQLSSSLHTSPSLSPFFFLILHLFLFGILSFPCFIPPSHPPTFSWSKSSFPGATETSLPTNCL